MNNFEMWCKDVSMLEQTSIEFKIWLLLNAYGDIHYLGFTTYRQLYEQFCSDENKAIELRVFNFILENG